MPDDILNSPAAAAPAAASPAAAGSTPPASAAAGPAKVDPPAADPGKTEPVPAEDPKLAAKFAALSRKERSILQREAAVKEKETKYSGYETLDKDMTADPIATLAKKWNVSYDKLTELALQGGKKSPEQRVAELEARLEADEQKRAKALEDERKANQQADIDAKVGAFKEQLGAHVTAAGDKYELVALHNNDEDRSLDVVLNVIEEHYQKTLRAGSARILTNDEALELVEKWYEQKIFDEKLLKSKKLQTRLAPPKPPELPKPAGSSTTDLTNGLHSNPPQAGDKKFLSDEESKKAAASMIRWK